MAEDLGVALEAELARQVDDADRALRLERIPGVALELVASYRRDAITMGIVGHLAYHLAEDPAVVLRAVAFGCAPGRHRDELIRLELRELQVSEAAK